MKKICVLLVLATAMMTISCSDDFQEIEDRQIENGANETGGGEDEPVKGDGG